MKKKLYAKLRYMRERFGVTQEQFALLIGCGTANYANKERGRVPWSLDECFIIKDYINKQLALKGEESITVDVLFEADSIELSITRTSKTPSPKKAI